MCIRNRYSNVCCWPFLEIREGLLKKNRKRILFLPGLLWKVASFLRPFSGPKIGVTKNEATLCSLTFLAPVSWPENGLIFGPPSVSRPPESFIAPHRVVLMAPSKG